MDEAIKIEENISETTRLKEKIRSQARKIIQLQQLRQIPPPPCQHCQEMKNTLAELILKVKQLAGLLKTEVVANEAMRSLIETSAESLQPVTADWRRFVQTSAASRLLVGGLLQVDAADRRQLEDMTRQSSIDRRDLAADMAAVVLQKAGADRMLVHANRRIEDLLADVSRP